MFFILSKILAFLTNPIIWIFLLLCAAYYFKNRRKKLLLIALITFYFFSNEFIFSEFMRAWEIKPNPQIIENRDIEVAIVLGGYANYDVAYDMIGFHESSDRLMMALELYHENKIDKIYLSGGAGSISDTLYKEAVFIRDFLLKMKLPKADIFLDSLSKNTHQNALQASNLLGEKYGNSSHLLITSGYHMRRAVKCFEKCGINVIPYSVDRIAGPRKFGISHLFLPNASTLSKWNTLIHEWVGYLTYFMMGYI